MRAQKTTQVLVTPVLCGLLLIAAGCGGDAATSAAGSTVTDPNNPSGDPNAPAGTAGTGTTTGGSMIPGNQGLVPGSDVGDVGGFADGPPPVTMVGETCIQEDVMITTTTPTVELLVDRSGSMNADFGVQDRWNTIRNVLVNQTNGFVKNMEGRVRFGLSLYTGFTADAEQGTVASCPDLVEVPIALNNYMPVYTTFMANEIGEATPSAESITAATAKLTAYTAEVGPKILVFATDGDPDSCADPDSNGEQAPRTASEMAVQAAWTAGITTYVIAVGDGIQDLQHMQNLAEIGAGGDPNAAYFSALDSTSLEAAFNTILRGVISCDFQLNGTVAPTAAGSGTVSIDGVALPYNDPNGWVLVGESTVRLQGTACDTLKISVTNVDINFPCGVVMIF